MRLIVSTFHDGRGSVDMFIPYSFSNYYLSVPLLLILILDYIIFAPFISVERFEHSFPFQGLNVVWILTSLASTSADPKHCPVQNTPSIISTRGRLLCSLEV